LAERRKSLFGPRGGFCRAFLRLLLPDQRVNLALDFPLRRRVLFIGLGEFVNVSSRAAIIAAAA
jgi:hypothetical protein